MDGHPEFGQDPVHADWLRGALTGAWGHVGGVVPFGYEAYARILHPVQVDEHRWAAWSEVAADAGTSVHPLVQWGSVSRADGVRAPWWHDSAPEEGNLLAAPLRRMLDILREHTTAPDDCWFGLWVGYGWVNGSAVMTAFHDGDNNDGEHDADGEDRPATSLSLPAAYRPELLEPGRLVRLPGREYLLGRGPLASALRIGHQVNDDWFLPQSPNLCWPEDRAWCVATEIDFDSTLVGGTRALVDRLLDDAVLEVLPVGPQDSLQLDADRINDRR